MEKIQYTEKIGDSIYTLNVDAEENTLEISENFQDKTLVSDVRKSHRVDSHSLLVEQCKLAIDRLTEEQVPNRFLLEYVFQLSGLKGKDFAKMLGIQGSSLTNLRRGKNNISHQTWMLLQLTGVNMLSKKISKKDDEHHRSIDKVFERVAS